MEKIAVLVAAIFAFVACSANDEPKETSPRIPRIGLSMDSFVVERWIRDRDIFVAQAQAAGAQVLVQVANEDHNTQVAQIHLLANQNIDVLVVIPNDSSRLGPTIRQVRDRGIPVISYDRLILKGKADLYIAHDHVKAGELMAQEIADKATSRRPGFRLVIVNGAKVDHNTALMNHGFHKVLDPLIAKGQIELLSEIWLTAWSGDEAQASFRPVVDRSKSLDGLIAANDMLAEALIRVLAQRSKLDGVSVTGMDADLSACQRVVEGTQLLTVYKPIGPLASTAAQYAVKMAKKESLDVQEFISDGEFEIPYVKLEPVAVRADNMRDVVVRDGYHSETDIYRK